MARVKTSLGESALAAYVDAQLQSFFPDGERIAVAPHLERALSRVEHCFSHIRTKYYFDGAQAHFDHLHSDQYAAFLYFLANTVHRSGGSRLLAAKLYMLNKALHALDAYFEVELPDIFCWQHPVGTVLGRGSYQDYLFVYQRVTVGGNLAGVYPRIGRGVCLFGDTALVGDMTVGDNVFVSIGTKIVEQDIPSASLVFGMSPTLTIKTGKNRDVESEMFRRVPVQSHE